MITPVIDFGHQSLIGKTHVKWCSVDQWNIGRGGITLLRTALVDICGLSALKSFATKSGPGCRIGHPAPSMQDVGKNQTWIYANQWILQISRLSQGLDEKEVARENRVRKNGSLDEGQAPPRQAGSLGGKKSLICKTVLLLPEAVVAHTGWGFPSTYIAVAI